MPEGIEITCIGTSVEGHEPTTWHGRFTMVHFTGSFVTRSEGNSDFGMREQTALGESWKILDFFHCY